MYSWKEVDPPRWRCISRSLDSIGFSDAYPPLALLVADNYLKETPKFGAETWRRKRVMGGNGREGNVGKTKSLLTGIEPKDEERQRAARKERSVRTVRETAGEKRERETKGKKEHTPPPAGPDETHACDPMPMAYRVSMPIRLLSSRNPSLPCRPPLFLPHLLVLFGFVLPKFRFHSFSRACPFFPFLPISLDLSPLFARNEICAFFLASLEFYEAREKRRRNERMKS